MVAALTLAGICAVAAGGLLEWVIARRRGWAAGYQAAQARNQATNAAVYLQLTQYERAEADRFNDAHA